MLQNTPAFCGDSAGDVELRISMSSHAELARERRERVASWQAARDEVAAKAVELHALRERYVAALEGL